MTPQTYFPGTRVIVFDSRLFKDDLSTPISRTMQPATVIRWYGVRSSFGWADGNLIDIVFDRDGHESHGHFANHIEVIQ